MSRLGGFNCPYCRYYNALDEQTCRRCERRLPPAWLSPVLTALGGVDLWATKALAATSIVIFALELVASGGLSGQAIAMSVPAGVLLRFGALTNGLEWAQPYRLLAACFVHMSVLHVAMNMLALAELGRAGEKLLGGSRFVFAYVVTGVVGFAVSTFWYGVDPYVTAGASGAIFGLDGMLVGDRMARRDPVWKDMLVRTVVHSVLFYYALRTNQAAHMGGLAAGLLLGFLFAREARPWKRDGVFGVIAGVSGLAIVASLVLPHASPAIEREPRPGDSARPRRPRNPRRVAPPIRPEPPAEGVDGGGEGER